MSENTVECFQMSNNVMELEQKNRAHPGTFEESGLWERQCS